MLLATGTLIPTSLDRVPLSVSTLRDLLMAQRTEGDRVEHVRAAERAGLIWIGAYVAVADQKVAQRHLDRLFHRILGDIPGWDFIGDGETTEPSGT